MADPVDGWSSAFSEEHGCVYYFNELLQLTQWHAPTQDDRTCRAEAAVAAALGFVDPIVHGLASRILSEQCSRSEATTRLTKHLPQAEAAACVEALFNSALVPTSDEEVDGTSEDGDEGDEMTDLAPWEHGRVPEYHSTRRSVAPAVQELTQLRVNALKRLVAAAGLDATGCVEKADLVSLLLCSDGSSGASGSSRSSGGHTFVGDGACGSSRVVPTAPPPHKDAVPSSNLHAEVLTFAEWVQPRPSEMRSRSAIQRIITRALQPLGEHSIAAYGSSQTGTGLFCSDLDLCFYPSLPLKQVAELLCETRDSGGRLAFRDVDVLPSSRVPIVSLLHAVTHLEVDLSCSAG